MIYTFSLGSNLGHRRYYIEEMVKFVDSLSLVPVKTSSLMETAPLEIIEGHKNYLNMIVLAEIELPPEKVLLLCQKEEVRLGRKGKGTLQPRTADLDILTAGNLKIDSRFLTIPHHAIIKRRFILEGLREIYPGLTISGHGRDVKTLYNSMEKNIAGQDLIRIC